MFPIDIFLQWKRLLNSPIPPFIKGGLGGFENHQQFQRRILNGKTRSSGRNHFRGQICRIAGRIEDIMSEVVCLYCEKPEGRNYKPPKGVDYICSTCVQAFLSADQDYLKWVYDLAIKNSMANKAWALESFILPEEENNESVRPKKHGRRFDRKGSLRPASDKKSRIEQVKA